MTYLTYRPTLLCIQLLIDLVGTMAIWTCQKHGIPPFTADQIQPFCPLARAQSHTLLLYHTIGRSGELFEFKKRNLSPCTHFPFRLRGGRSRVLRDTLDDPRVGGSASENAYGSSDGPPNPLDSFFNLNHSTFVTRHPWHAQTGADIVSALI